jgi:dTDP-4-dehydrorhamnose 3,5-epimerase-like enzyme
VKIEKIKLKNAFEMRLRVFRDECRFLLETLNKLACYGALRPEINFVQDNLSSAAVCFLPSLSSERCSRCGLVGAII